MARPKETDEQKVKKVYPDAFCDYGDVNDYTIHYWITTPKLDEECKYLAEPTSGGKDAAWSDALTQIRKTKIKAAKDKRKPIKVPKEIKKHVGLTMYPSDKAMIVKGFGSVQKFLDKAIREYKSK